jgi:glyoxylase-like metal-dependent hydrolase (beta-lactamase superfamily II)
VDSSCYSFKVGDFECMAISDGSYVYAPPDFPPPAMFLFYKAPVKSLELAMRKHNLPAPWTEWTSPYICLVVNTGKNIVLVDTGAGNLAPTTGKLLENLRAGGIMPGDIDTVIITHGHPDHLGGNTDKEGKPAFANARHVMWKDEWDFWTTQRAEKALEEHSREILIQYARRNLTPVQSQLDLVDREAEIIPGISAVAAPGHTPGMMALAISSKNERLLCVSDAVLHPIHLEQPDWCCALDVVPESVGMTRHKLLDRAAAEKALVIAFHFPFPGLGRIIRKGKSWRWQPEEKAGSA